MAAVSFSEGQLQVEHGLGPEPTGLSRAADDSRVRLVFEHMDVLRRGKINFPDLVARLQGCIHAGDCGLNRNLTWRGSSPAAAALRVLLSLDAMEMRRMGYAEFVHFLCCFMHAGGASLGDFLGALLTSFDLQFSLPAEQNSELLIREDGRPLEERRLEGMYEALSAAGSNVVSLSRVAQALEGYEPSREPADSARQAAAAKLAEYRSATAPLDRFSFARCMTEFAQAMGVGLDEVVDYLSAIFLASGPELRGAKVSGIFAGCRLVRLDSVQDVAGHKSLRSYFLEDLELEDEDGEGHERGEGSPSAPTPPPKACPPHGARQTPGVRSEMEDSYITIPNFLYVNMQDSQKEKWPVRLASADSSNASSPCAERAAKAGRLHGLEEGLEGLAEEAEGVDTAGSTSASSGSGKETLAAQLYSDTFHFFGVFDGHGGAAAAIHCTKRLHTHVVAALRQRPDGGGGGGGDGEGSPPLVRKLPSRTRSRVDVLEVPLESVVDGGAEPPQPPSTPTKSPTTPPASPDAFTSSPANSGPINGHYIEGVSTVGDLEDALSSAFKRTDEEFCATDGADYVGSTAVCTLVGSRFLCVANCGDSRAVLGRAGGQVVQLTDDHKPDREDEKSRVEAAGGQILYWNGRRVMGVLAMSRAIGDQCLQPYVIPDPEITVVQRRDDDELVVMGSDGLWDVLSNEEAVALARKALARAGQKGADARSAAKVAATVLIRAALSKGSRDNITVIVVDLTSTHSGELAAPGEGGVAASRGAIARGGSADHRSLFSYDSHYSPPASKCRHLRSEEAPAPKLGHVDTINMGGDKPPAT